MEAVPSLVELRTPDGGPFHVQAASGGRRELDGIQLIRGLAAIFVVLFHTHTMSALPKYFNRTLFGGVLEAGTVGVDLFFCLSGFIIVYVSLAPGSLAPSIPVAEFLRRRFARIVPFMWVAVLAYSLFRLAARGEFDVFATLRTLVLWPVGEPSLNVVWTLRHEAIFYVLFAVTFLCRRPWWLLAWFMAPLAMAWFNPPELVALVCNRVNLLFGLGVAVGVLYQRAEKHTDASLWALVAALAALLVSAHAFGYDRKSTMPVVVIGLVAAACIWLGARAALTGWPRRIAHLLGDASYSIYLTHTMAISACLGVLPKVWRAAPDAAIVLLISGFATVFGIAVHHVVEKPVVRFSRKLLAARKAPALA